MTKPPPRQGLCVSSLVRQFVVAVAALEVQKQRWEDPNFVAAEARREGGRALAATADVADATALSAAAARVRAEFGAPAILVNSAGIAAFEITQTRFDIFDFVAFCHTCSFLSRRAEISAERIRVRSGLLFFAVGVALAIRVECRLAEVSRK